MDPSKFGLESSSAITPLSPARAGKHEARTTAPLPRGHLRIAAFRDHDQLHRSPGSGHTFATDESFKNTIGWNDAQYGFVQTVFQNVYVVGLVVGWQL